MNEQDELPGGSEELSVPEDATEAEDIVEEAAPEAGETPGGDELPETGEDEAAPGEVELPKIDLNTATEEELQQLPGIGPALAARIVNYRVEVQPFEDPAGITAVPGVSEAMYARIAGRLIVGPAEPALAVEPEIAEMELEEFEEVPVLEIEPEAVAPEPEPDVSPVYVKPPPGPEPPLVEVVPAPMGWGRLLFVGLLSAIVGAVLALAFLFAFNGTLDYRMAAVQAARGEVVRLEGELDALSQELGQMEERLGAIQELESRVADLQSGIRRLAADLGATQAGMESMAETARALRQEFTNMREDLDGLTEHVSQLASRAGEVEEQLATLSQEMEALGESVQRFDAFLDGLLELLNESQGALGPAPTPMPGETPTLRPMVTVIPVATPTATP